MSATIGGMGATRYLKQFAIGVLLAACFMLICNALVHGKPALIMVTALLATLNTALYPYSHLVQERLEGYFRKNDNAGTRNTVANTNDDSGIQINGDSAVDNFLSLMLLIALLYFLLTVGLRAVFWLLALPLAYFGIGLLQSEPKDGI